MTIEHYLMTDDTVQRICPSKIDSEDRVSAGVRAGVRAEHHIIPLCLLILRTLQKAARAVPMIM